MGTRVGTVRSWIREQININPNFTSVKQTKENKKNHFSTENLETKFGPESVNGIQIDMRCQVFPGNRRGTVAYVGIVPELGLGQWVGVAFDEPDGMNDGTVPDGKRYFHAKGQHYGGFVRAKHLKF